MASFTEIAALVIFVISIIAIITLVLYPVKFTVPWTGLDLTFSYAWMPVIGVILNLCCTSMSFKDVGKSIAGDDDIEPYAILIIFMALAYIASSLDMTGVFAWLALKITYWSGGRGTTLFFLYFGLSAVVTAVTSNDVSIMTLTPIICYFARATEADPIPFLVAEFAAANLWSMLLFVGNPTNIIVAQAYGMSFVEYLRWMLLPVFGSAVVCVGVLYIQFRRRLPVLLKLPSIEPAAMLTDRLGAILGTGNIAACLALLGVAPTLGWPLWPITLACAGAHMAYNLVALVILKRPDGGSAERALRLATNLPANRRYCLTTADEAMADGILTNDKGYSSLLKLSKRNQPGRFMWQRRFSESGHGSLSRMLAPVPPAAAAFLAADLAPARSAPPSIMMVQCGQTNVCHTHHLGAPATKAPESAALAALPRTADLRREPLQAGTAVSSTAWPAQLEPYASEGGLYQQAEREEAAVAGADISSDGGGPGSNWQAVAHTGPQMTDKASILPSMPASFLLPPLPPSIPVHSARTTAEGVAVAHYDRGGVEAWPVAPDLTSGSMSAEQVAVLEPLPPPDPALLAPRDPSFMLTLRTLPWEVVPFILGMFGLVWSLEVQGWIDQLAKAMGSAGGGSLFASIFVFGWVSVLLSNVVNNQPMTILLTRVCLNPQFVAQLGGDLAKQRGALLAVVVGSNLGASFTLIGSLAAIMWADILHRMEVRMTYIRFARMLLPTGITGTFAALLMVWASFSVFKS